MAGLTDTDIRLDDNWQITAAASGDALLVSGLECFLQDIRIEALTQEGEVFYDETWGWSLLDFMQSQDDELLRLEIEQRVRTKLARREEIDPESIRTTVEFLEDVIAIRSSFRFVDSDQTVQLDVELDRVKVEVRLA
ncbi:baseplate assembly protein [Citrobacter freundii ATCC 8090 = MTCC 1658 = NBRC 12681]|uniref:hypothetical protein n=1 Tax=Citrobacter freundii TaxID=546 RepID=UPI000299B655|nr:hypothetical protein [Citrobacter freundii]EKS54342.1 baseplate assembly protein [Citrobacter freundii ATCC 8090 = MTCC 1658 = NBRC 12681]